MVYGRSFAANIAGGNNEQAVQAHLTGAALRIPCTGSDREPIASPMCFLLGILAVVLGRQLGDNKPLLHSRKHDNGTIFALGWVLFIGHPRPHDLAGIRIAIGIWLVLERRESVRANIPHFVPLPRGLGGRG